MKVIFGPYLDGAIWSGQHSALGQVRTGPLGLLSILETYLGLSALPVHPAIRINEYMQRMEKIDCNEAWFHKSFQLDPWATASQLLSWRDELVVNGWTNNLNSMVSPRLKCLGDIECVNIPISNGEADRLQMVIKYLKDDFPIPIRAIELLEEGDTLPLVWQKILKLLQAQGTEITVREKPIIQRHHSNLSHVQACLSNIDNNGNLSPDDDSLILLRGNNEWELAEHIAYWLSLKEDTHPVTFICEGDTTILDLALAKFGLPTIGNSSPSSGREIQQLLPLLFKNLWEPINIDDLADLLSLNISIFSPWISNILLSAINREPGVGGRAWQRALEQIENYHKLLQNGDKKEQTDKDNDKKKPPLTEGEIKALLEKINQIFINNRFEPNEGIPEEKLQEVCQIYIDRCMGFLHKEPALIDYINQARLVQELVKGKGKISRIMLDKLLATIIGSGNKSFDRYQEVSKWRVVKHPGQIIEDSCEVIWWGFNDFNAKPSTYWTEAEHQALADEGVRLDDTHKLRQGELQAWLRSFMQTKKRFIGLHAKQINGEIISPHPFWDMLFHTAKGNIYSNEEVANFIVRDQKGYYGSDNWQFAGINAKLTPRSPIMPITKENPYTYDLSLEDKDKIRLDYSYTQAETLISCPFRWFLDYYAGLRFSPSRQTPHVNLILGNISHRIIEEMYKKTKVWQAEAAQKEAAEQFDILLPSMASYLLLEGNALTKSRHKKVVVEAVGNLVEKINNLNLKVKETEKALKYTTEYNDREYHFEGFADLWLNNDNNDDFILDLKWSFKTEDYEDRVREAIAIQLAIYYKMLKETNGNSSIHTAYYLLPSADLITDSELLSNNPIKTSYSNDKVWNMTMKVLDERIEALEKGIIVAKGCEELAAVIKGDLKVKDYVKFIRRDYLSDNKVYLGASCDYCDYRFLCGYREVSK